MRVDWQRVAWIAVGTMLGDAAWRRLPVTVGTRRRPTWARESLLGLPNPWYSPSRTLVWAVGDARTAAWPPRLSDALGGLTPAALDAMIREERTRIQVR